MGLSYLPLAHAGLDALESWCELLPHARLRPHFKHILPYLDDYLQTSSSDLSRYGDQNDDTQLERKLSSAEGRRNKTKAVSEWQQGVEGAETPLDRLRRRIVYFLGSLGGAVNSCMIETGSAAMRAAKVVAWDRKSKLEFALPFQDMKPSIFLGMCKCM